MWVQAASAQLFGFSPLSLLLPEAILSTLAVAVLYRVIARRLGVAAGLAAALALAVFPSFVAVSRDNGVDPLLILLMILACGAALNSIKTAAGAGCSQRRARGAGVQYEDARRLLDRAGDRLGLSTLRSRLVA